MLGGAGRSGREGTRFRLFAQSPFDQDDPVPEIVEVSSPAGLLGPGPADDRMYLVWPIGKEIPFGLNTGPGGTPWLYLPPWRGPVRPPVLPSPDGHFDHLPPGSDEFEAAHLFGTVRVVLDVWERYLGGPLPWHFAGHFDRLELTLLPWWQNAQMGYGYLEAGSDFDATGRRESFALNFEVIAHEVGHGIVYSWVGVPDLGSETGEYLGFHESAADWVAMLASVHFSSVVAELLKTTSGNLYTFNHFNRFAVLSKTKQIRLASNSLKMSDFAGGWYDEHTLSQPLTGCIFDIFVDLFHDILLERGVVGRGADELFEIARDAPERIEPVQREFDRVFARAPEAFHEAFVTARDAMGALLVETWGRLRANDLTYAQIGEALLAADQRITGGRLSHNIRSNLLWREIGMVEVGPRLAPPGPDSHSYSSRTSTVQDRRLWPRPSYRERYLIACQCLGRASKVRPKSIERH